MYRYTLTVPTVLNDGTPVAEERLEGVLHNLTELFGGCTVIDAVGAWAGERLYTEPCMLFVVDTENVAAGDMLRAYAESLADALAQECIYLTRQEIDTWLVAPSPVETKEA